MCQLMPRTERDYLDTPPQFRLQHPNLESPLFLGVMCSRCAEHFVLKSPVTAMEAYNKAAIMGWRIGGWDTSLQAGTDLCVRCGEDHRRRLERLVI